MNPTTMADISRSKRSVVMSAMPDCSRMVVFSDLIGSSSLSIGIEIGHAAESNLGGQVSADVFASGCRGGGGTRAEVNVDGTDLVFIVTPGAGSVGTVNWFTGAGVVPSAKLKEN